MNLRWSELLGSLTLALLLATPVLAADHKAPHIRHHAVAQATAGQALEIRVKITDPSGVFDPTLYYRNVGTKDYLRATLVEDKKNYVATIPATALKTDIEYFVEAYDELGNGPARVGRPSRPLRIRVLMTTKHTTSSTQEPRPHDEDSASGNAASISRTKETSQASSSGSDGAPHGPTTRSTTVEPKPTSPASSDSTSTHSSAADAHSQDTAVAATSGPREDPDPSSGDVSPQSETEDGSLLPILAAGAGGALLLLGAGGAAVAYLLLNQPAPSVVTLKVGAPAPVASLRGVP